MLLAAIDPGTRGSGLALFSDAVLFHAEYVSGIGGQAHPLLEVAVEIGGKVEDLGTLDELVIELPQVYDTPGQKGDQGDLVNLAVALGAQMASVSVRSVLLVRPNSWKGQTPKEIQNERTQAALSDEERAAVQLPRATGLHHNVWDAVGIGLWRLKKERAPF